MIVLGMHFGHDGAACIVKDGRLVAALASERLTRAKKSAGVPENVLDAVLETASIRLEQVDAIAITDWYSPWRQCDIECRSDEAERYTDQDGNRIGRGAVIHDSWNRIWDDEVWRMEVTLRGRKFPGYNVGHQKAHCASAFYTSPYKQAWCMSMDASGAEAKNNFMIARGNGNRLDWFPTPCCMVGYLYGRVCNGLAIGHELHKAGAMMALASYGNPEPEIAAKWVDGAFCDSSTSYVAWGNAVWDQLRCGRSFTHETSDSSAAMDIAATTQALFEAAVLKSVGMIPRDRCTNLCLSGGSFLNCTVNSRIRRETRFNRIHHFPGCGDDGCPVGAALYVAHAIHDEPRHNYSVSDIAYLGPNRDEPPVDVDRVADALAQNKLVAWFRGRSEYGPRALGHRSILANPTIPGNRDRINQDVKHREWYRPLSPSVLAEDCADWFDWPHPAAFMLYTAQARCPERIPAVLHVDNSARMQTVRKSDNPAFYRLIEAFEARTGVPMVLNTSLNVDGQPILETEQDAAEFWQRVQVDMMVVGGQVWER